MRALVTGGLGFVGSAVVRHAVERGWNVTTLDSLDPRVHAREPPRLPEGVRWIHGDIDSDTTIGQALEPRPDVVFHQAALVGLGQGAQDLEEYIRINVLATARLARALARVGAPAPRLVLASTMAIFGEGAYTCPACHEPRDAKRQGADLAAGRWDPICSECGIPLVPRATAESHPPQPGTFYARSKLLQEQTAIELGRELGVPTVALRYHNVYGPWMPRNSLYSGVTAAVLSRLAERKPPTVYEDGRQLRDFIHVDDVARANLLAAEAPVDTVDGQAFHVATGEPRELRELVERLTRRLAPDTRPGYPGTFRPGDARHIFASVSKISRELGFRAKVRFEEGIDALDPGMMRPPVVGGDSA
ncbi:MAG: NAD-dependent epimerase/dehydratase family protein [Thermoplasmata archaeon]|nr:NAD-dependent epimerase/dehydratase family protein [Thermoplasmata archaeon]